MIYDNNAVTVDGNIDGCFTEDTSAKLAAQGWHVIEVDDGSNNVSSGPYEVNLAHSFDSSPAFSRASTRQSP